MAKIGKSGLLSASFTRFLAFGEDKDRLELSVQGEKSLEALARFGGKALDDVGLSVYSQPGQLLVCEAFARNGAEKRPSAIGIRTLGTSGIEDQ